ncbi:prolyl endopeptidase-like [Contarinia nasturtii]|uniref:prolyl endopeptidase-like n=1 Tax=Contarinia nasturtii TaxID=265458 RepID=UPI0012D3ACCA|nr:prolyl endopeptidase-like [Contarinia nasturtii]
MKYTSSIPLCLIAVLTVKVDAYGINSADKNRNFIKTPMKYPDARRDESILEDLHGKKIADPYRWLEDPFSEETKQFVDAENEISQSFLENNDKWKKINTNLTKLWNYQKYFVPMRHGKYYFSFRNSGLQNQNVLYKQNSLNDDEEPTVFLDPNAFSSDGTISLQEQAFSKDGNLFAYGVSESGSDWIKIKIRNVQTGEDYSELLERIKFTSLAWTHDNKGFFYNRYDQGGDGSETDTNENQKLYYHRVGEPQEKDVLVVEFTDNLDWLIVATVSLCGKYLIVTPYNGHQSSLYFADLEKNGAIVGKILLTSIVTKFEAEYVYITNTGSKVVFRTNIRAPNYRVVVIDFNHFTEDNWTTLVKEDSKDVIQWAKHVDKDKLVISYLQDVKDILKVHCLETGKLLRKFPLEIGTIVGFSGNEKYSEVFYQLESFLTPGTIYRYDFSNPDTEPTVFIENKLNLNGFDKKNFKVEQVFYPSHDGTKIPMFIVQKKTASKTKPVLLHGYGGFNIAIPPEFKVPFLFFVNAFDGILAIANIRGGAEYGQKWHDAGKLLNKQNVFDDFQAAAEYLVTQKYTINKKIAIYGRSNGGLLVGACINQRPELFGAAVAQVGVMDMLRFHKFTSGHSWITDYGDPDEKVHFDNLYKFSPLHNVHVPNSTVNQYPPTIILTGDHDDRVSPLHSLKLTATLQHAVKNNKFQNNPILLRVYSKAGHGDGKPIAKRIEEETDIHTFLYQSLQIDADI